MEQYTKTMAIIIYLNGMVFLNKIKSVKRGKKK